MQQAGAEDTIAIFPLGTVLVPGLTLPLQIFEPRYVTLLQDLAGSEDPAFGVVGIRSGHEVGTDRTPSTYEVGTTAAIGRVTWLPDGRAQVTTQGAQRFRILGEVPGRPYRQALVRWLGEPAGEDAAGAAGAVRAEFTRYQLSLGQAVVDLPSDPTALSYAVAAGAILDLPVRQSLLEITDTTTRLQELGRLLRQERHLLAHLPSLPAVDLPRTSPDLN